MNIQTVSFSHAKPGRENEDSLLECLKTRDIYCFAIADGIGGNPGGKIASNLAIKELEDLMKSDSEISMQKLFLEIKNKIEKESKSNKENSEMGTTLSVCVLNEGTARVGHVGDSRIYHLRGNGILKRTVDQTQAQRLLDQGVISKARAKKYPRHNILYSALSASGGYELYEIKFDIIKDDRIILLTDGVSNLLTLKEIRDISLQSQSIEQLKEIMENQIMTLGPVDDYSAVILEVK